MKTNEPLNIPPAILALNDVTASEKLLLALYAAEPDAKNFMAMQVLGVGLAGLKKIKRRSRDKHYLLCKANGCVVNLPGLVSGPEETGGHFVSNSKAISKENKVALPTRSLRRVASAEEVLDNYIATWELALREQAHVSTLHYIVQSTLDSIMDLPDERERNLMLAEFTKRRDAFFALSYASEHLPRQYQRQVDRLIAKSTPEQLAKLRVAIEQAQLAGAKPVFLLKQMSGQN